MDLAPRAQFCRAGVFTARDTNSHRSAEGGDQPTERGRVMKGKFGKAVAVVGASFAVGLLLQTLAVASPAPSGSAVKSASAITAERDQIRKRDRKKDGSCLISMDQIRKQDKKKDGSCTS